jgi:hypothetical protein
MPLRGSAQGRDGLTRGLWVLDARCEGLDAVVRGSLRHVTHSINASWIKARKNLACPRNELACGRIQGC